MLALLPPWATALFLTRALVLDELRVPHVEGLAKNNNKERPSFSVKD